MSDQQRENPFVVAIIKVFTLAIRADNRTTLGELGYVKSYLDTICGESASWGLFVKFLDYLAAPLDVDATVNELKELFPYEQRLFLLLKVQELLSADSDSEHALPTTRSFAKKMDVRDVDLDIIEELYRSQGHMPRREGASIEVLTVASEPERADIVLPMTGLFVRLLKIGSSFYVLQCDELYQLEANGYPLSRNFVAKLQCNYNLKINNYTVSYVDLIYYFRRHVAPSKVNVVYLARTADNKTRLDVERSPASLLRVETERSLIWVEPMKDDAPLMINNVPANGAASSNGTLANGSAPAGTDGAGTNGANGAGNTKTANGTSAAAYSRGSHLSSRHQVNLDDRLRMDGMEFDLRKILFETVPEEYPSQSGRVALTITNHPGTSQNAVLVYDDLPTPWVAQIVRDGGAWSLEIGACPHDVFVNDRRIKLHVPTRLHDSDTIYIRNLKLVCDLKTGFFQTSLSQLRTIDVVNLGYRFERSKNKLAIDDVSFRIGMGELVCVLGPSGCGKSTLFSILTGFNKPSEGQVLIGGRDLHREHELFKHRIGFVPQENLLFEELTVFENLYFSARLRFPFHPDSYIRDLVQRVMNEVALAEKADTFVGGALLKTLSGGERKRLNIGLELLSESDIYFLDEPTSGLSSKDSEKIIELLKNLSLRGKMIFVVIHQPSSKIFNLFDRVVFLDRGGKLAFFGTVRQALLYFAGEAGVEVDAEDISELEPDLLLETLETPLINIDGTPLPQRKNPPEYWKRKYQEFTRSRSTIEFDRPRPIDIQPFRQLGWTDRLWQFLTLLQRDFISKLRNRFSLFATFAVGAALAITVGMVCRQSDSRDYSLYNNEAFPNYLFLTVVTIFFLSLSNSLHEIIRDRHILLREKMLNIRVIEYLGAKITNLMFFTVLQIAVFLVITFPILKIYELFFPFLGFLSVVGLCG
ncbi:MAG TPA: ATP-binding cassette domain-containing protein, partial [Candidatus Methylacidiphilales bacterium]|nr:ATP-binding cassette domain-containing protein [Candidatus Methylacidiphilales bacterium]